jgi:hypothetical protein
MVNQSPRILVDKLLPFSCTLCHALPVNSRCDGAVFAGLSCFGAEFANKVTSRFALTGQPGNLLPISVYLCAKTCFHQLRETLYAFGIITIKACC